MSRMEARVRIQALGDEILSLVLSQRNDPKNH